VNPPGPSYNGNPPYGGPPPYGGNPYSAGPGGNPGQYPPPRQPVYPPPPPPYYNRQPDSQEGQYGQQAQWTFNDYGPIGEPEKPKKEKKPRKAKAESAPEADGAPRRGNGVKVLAVVMSVLFVLCAGGFAGYAIYVNSREPAPVEEDIPASSEPYHIQDPPPVTSVPEEEPAITGEQMTPSQLYKAVEPSVVGVVGYYRNPTTGMFTPASQGSGVVFDAQGYIVTNRHVIKNAQTNQDWDKVEIIRSTGETYTAEVLGSDSETDLAVLRVETEGLTSAVLGDSDRVQVGDSAFVIGNPSGIKYAGSLTGGYISAVNREVTMESTGTKVELIQTDAAINPGNSGGALIDIYGQVIGITSAKVVGEEYEGMGFAIPINDVKPIVESLVDNGYVTGRVQIGLTYQVISQTIADLNGIPQGLRVVSVDEASDAYAKGLRPGDIIYRMDGEEVHDTPDVKKILAGKNPGEQIVLSVYRVGADDHAERLELSVTLQEKVSGE